MGGNATKHFGTKRVPNDQYNKIVSILSDFDDCFPAKTFAKPDHGDIDVICTSVTRDKIIDELNITDIVKTGNVWSCVLEFENGRYQVDFIVAPKENLDYTAKWYCYGNMSLLIGRIIPKELKFAHDALKLRSCDEPIIEEFDTALEFLGFDVVRYNQGFDTKEEMLDWLADSKYFVHNGIVNNWRNSNTKRRDSKRTTLDDEISYLLDNPEKNKMPNKLWARWHYLERQHIKKRRTYQYGLNRLRRIRNMYCLSNSEYMALYHDFQNNPLKWVSSEYPVNFEYDTKLNEQKEIILKLVDLVGLTQAGTTKTTKRNLAQLVDFLKLHGYSDQDLVRQGVSTALLKGW